MHCVLSAKCVWRWKCNTPTQCDGKECIALKMMASMIAGGSASNALSPESPMDDVEIFAADLEAIKMESLHFMIRTSTISMDICASIFLLEWW